MRSARLFSVLILCICVVCVGACGGGSDSGADGTAGLTISGTVSAPGGAVALFEDRTVGRMLANLIVPPVCAVINGLEPVPGATVELIMVDDTGAQVGEVLARTVTSITGDYRLVLPAGIDLAANLVVRVTGGGSELRAQVVEESVDIDPSSEYVLRRLIESGTQLENVAANEVVLLRGQVEEFNLTAGADLSETLAQLEAVVGDTLDEMIEVIDEVQEAGGEFAGTYHLATFDLLLRYNAGIDCSTPGMQGSPFGATRVDIEEGTVTLAYQSDGVYGITFEGGGTDAELMAMSDGTGGILAYDLFLETFLDESDEASTTLSAVDDGGFAYTIPFEEAIRTDLEPPSGMRWAPSTEIFYPLGDGTFVALPSESGVQYCLTPEEDAVDPSSVVGRETTFFFDFLAAASEGLTSDSLSGAYGLVGFGLALNGGGASEVFVDRVELSLGSGALDGTGRFLGISRVPDLSGLGVTLNFWQDESLLTGDYTVESDGGLSVTIDDEEDEIELDGFVANQGDLLVLMGNDEELAGEDVLFAERNCIVGVKLPSGAVDLAGKTYRFYELEINYGISGKTGLVRIPAGTVTFGADDTATASGTEHWIERPDDLSDYTAGSESFEDEGITYTVDAGTITINAGDGVMKGYIAADGSVIVLQTVEFDEDEAFVGMMIAVEAAE